MPAVQIQVPKQAIEEFCVRNGIRKLSLFGSGLTNQFHDGSDVDLLIELDADRTTTYLDLARMERELSELIGRKADLRTPQELSRYFRNQVEAEALVQYERK
jgi:predicted nucleotidyltransferase